MSLSRRIKADQAALGAMFDERDIASVLQAYADALIEAQRHGHYQQWEEALTALPSILAHQVVLNTDAIRCEAEQTLSQEQQTQLQSRCEDFIPWRKGPFNLFGLAIDTEWQSNIKWNRLEACLDLRDKRVFDVGCGNGYYAWRMLGAGAQSVLGVDPFVLYWFQYALVSHYMPPQNLAILPMTLEAFPEDVEPFDVVFSMGVLYHRRSPIEHLDRLRNHLQKGGQLILETLVIEGDETTCLCPEKKYANMNNVWFLPSCSMLERWLHRCKFVDIEKIDDSVTTVDEQRSTAWMPYHSLAEALNHEQTIEGYSAPRRVVYSARTKV